MKFRIKHIENIGHFAQVKTSFFTGWETIGKSVYGFNLYPEDHIDYPLKEHHDALERCKEYKRWAKDANDEPTYTYM